MTPQTNTQEVALSTEKSPGSNGAGWRIVEAEVRNYRSVRFIRWTPTGDIDVMVGENRSGKTQFIAALVSAIKGGMPGVDVIRHGEDFAEIKIHLQSGGDAHLYIEKTIEPGKWKLTVRRSPGGKAEPSPQKILDEIAGALVDPSALAIARPQERIDMMLKAMGLGDELKRLEASEKKLVAEREEIGRKRRDKKGELEGIPFPPTDTPDDLIDTAALMIEKNQRESLRRIRQRAVSDHEQRAQSLGAARERQAELEADLAALPPKIEAQLDKVTKLKDDEFGLGSAMEPLQIERADILEQIQVLQTRLDRRTNELRDLESKLGTVMSTLRVEEARLAELEAEPAALGAKVAEQETRVDALAAEYADNDPALRAWGDEDTTEIDAQLSNSKTINAQVANKQRWQAVAKQKADLDAEWNAIDAQIGGLQKQKAALLETAPWPYPGMGIGDGDITVNGCLWGNLSAAETVAVSTAVAFSLSPNFRFAALSQASWMSEKTKRIVYDLAEEHDFHLLLERQIGDPDATIIIEDGAVVGAENRQPEHEVTA